MPFTLMPQKLPKGISESIGKSVGGLGVTPNMISVFGFFGNVAASWFITRGDLLTAGIIYLVFSALDLVDGAVARATGQVTEYGAVNLRGRTLRERAELLISIAHPDFRNELRQAATARHLFV